MRDGTPGPLRLKRGLYDRATAPIQDYPVQLTIILDSSECVLNPQMYGVYQTRPFDMVLLQFPIDGALPDS